MSKLNKWLLIIIMLAVSTQNVLSQVSLTEIRPSVNAASFIPDAAGSKVNLSTGQPSISYNLHTLSSRDNSINVSMSFDAINVDHSTEAGFLGLGWKLNYGGVITKIVKDRPDEFNNHVITASTSSVQWLNELINFDVDKEEDIYYYSLPDGSSGSFLYSNLEMSPDKSYKLEQIDNGENWKITDDRGYQYFFTEQEKIYTAQSYTNVPSAWFLSSIVSPKGDTVVFQYDYEDYTLKDLSLKLSGTVDPNRNLFEFNFFSMDNLIGSSRIDKHYHSLRIKKIITETGGSIEFEYASRNDRLFAMYGNPYTEIKNAVGRLKKMTIKNRYDVGVYSYIFDNNDYFITDNENPNNSPDNYRLKLNQVSKVSANQSRSLMLYKFDYDYEFLLPKSGFTKWPLLYPPLRNAWAPSKQSVIFNYNESELFQITTDDEFSGPITAHYYYGRPESYSGANSTKFVLKEIEYGTGGKTEFEYEYHNATQPNRASPADEYVPLRSGFTSPVYGRLKSKTLLSYSGETLAKESYYYVKHDENYNWLYRTFVGDTIYESSGHWLGYPIYSAMIYQPNEKSMVHVSNYPLNEKGSNFITYSEVEVVKQNTLGNTEAREISFFGVGTPIYSGGLTYYQKRGAGIQEYVYIENINNTWENIYGSDFVTGPGECLTCDPKNYYSMFMPIPPPYDYSKILSNLTSKVYLNSSGTLLQKEDYEYGGTFLDRSGILLDDRSNSSTGNLEAVTRGYTTIEGKSVIQSQSNTKFALNGSKTDDSEYLRDSKNRNYATKTITADNRVFKTITYYADNLLTGNEGTIVSDMVDKNMITLPLVKISGYEENGNLLATQVTIIEYKNTNQTIKPYNYYVEKLSSPTIIDLTNYYKSNSGNLIINPNWKLTAQLDYYDNNLVEIVDTAMLPTVLLWSHDNSRIAAEIKGISYNDFVNILGQTWIDNLRDLTDTATIKTKQTELRTALANSNVLITTYNYHESFGLSTITDANGLETKSEFDDFGRLKKDKVESFTVKEYDTKFRNEEWFYIDDQSGFTCNSTRTVNLISSLSNSSESNFSWQIDKDASIVSGNGTSSPTINFGTESPVTLSYQVTKSNGAIYNGVAVFHKFAYDGFIEIQGSEEVSAFSTNTYSLVGDLNNLPSGYTIAWAVDDGEFTNSNTGQQVNIRADIKSTTIYASILYGGCAIASASLPVKINSDSYMIEDECLLSITLDYAAGDVWWIKFSLYEDNALIIENLIYEGQSNWIDEIYNYQTGNPSYSSNPLDSSSVLEAEYGYFNFFASNYLSPGHTYKIKTEIKLRPFISYSIKDYSFYWDGSIICNF